MKGNKVKPEVEDEKRDRLIRAAWILTYRRQQGEVFSELKEKRFILKHLRYCSVDVFWKRKTEGSGGLLYNRSGIKKEIGSEMTDTTFQDYPVCESETQGEIKLSTARKPHRIKFRRQ